MLWIDKYRPESLEDIDLHPETTSVLENLGKSKNIPHLLVYGPPGGGKRTRVMALLNKQFGPGVFNVRLEHKTLQVTESKSIEVSTLSSLHHIDINPSDAGTYDRVIAMQMIREIAQSVPVNSPTQFKVVVINEADRLSRGAQQALRRTMEKYMSTCRLILICSSISRLIPPLRSRCLSIRVPLHNVASISKVVRGICEKENLPQPSDAFCNTLCVRSEGNLRRAILTLEACKMNDIKMTDSGEAIPMPDWKFLIGEIASNIISEQSPRMLHEIRAKFYELLGHCVPGDHIMRELLLYLIAIVPKEGRCEICSAAAVFDVNMKMGSKPVMHLEAFAATAMRIIKQHRTVVCRS
eukprot:Tbor_TRINITY_DN6110_c1_g1::TRINITY_DN6110_c1_g1_i1::g.21880::m.21880/K10756/RFC3_5; replication factor C subunit 3/5